MLIPLNILHRIVAVHSSAADKNRASPVMSGVVVSVKDGNISIAATNGHLLIEESYPIDEPDREEVLLARDGVKMLKAWLKSVNVWAQKLPEITWDQTARVIRMTYEPVGQVSIATVEGTFPAYRKALEVDDNRTMKPRIGLDSEYLAAISDCWGEKGNIGLVMDFRSKGILVSPMCQLEGIKRGLIMPITLAN